MTIEKDGFKLFEFTYEDEFFADYCEYLREYENIKMIGRQEYLLSMDKHSIAEYLKQLNDSVNDSFFGVCYDGKFIGTVKVGHIDWRIGTGDLGIMIGDKNYRGKGLSERICSIALDYAFNVLGLRRMSAGCYEDNIAMCKCFERIGFKKIGVERENVTLEGKYCNHVLYDILKSEMGERQNEQ